MRSSSGNLRQSSMFRAAEWLGRGASVWSLPVSARDAPARPAAAAVGGPDRRRRSARSSRCRSVAVLLIFSSVEQGIEFEAVRGLQVARGLFLQQVQRLAAGAAALGDDAVLLRAPGGGAGSARQRLGELSLAIPNALFEITDATGRVVARCARGSCDDAPSAAARRAGAGRPLAGHPARARLRAHRQRRARARSAGGARRAAAGRSGAAAARRGGGDGADRRAGRRRLKAALGAGREVVVYAAGDPNASTFMAATGRAAGRARCCPSDFTRRRPGHGHDGRAAGGRRPPLLGRASASSRT